MSAHTKYYLDVVVRIIVAVICGGAIGFERENRNKNVGVRTYMTVCLSTSVVMIIAKMCFRDTNSGDVTRMAAAAIQGISFLGAGLIIHKDDNLKGITTAASLWYFLGIAATIALIFVGHVWIKLLNNYKISKKK